MVGSSIEQAVSFLQSGEVVAIPTETVYGLAGNAYDEGVVRKIFSVKGRPLADPLIVHGRSLEAVMDFIVGLPPLARRLAVAFWPGALTLLLPKRSVIPDIVTAGRQLVAVRVPSHPLTRSILARLPFPLAAPSANPFGYISPTCAGHVERQLGDRIPYILDGGCCEVGVESTVVGGFDGERPMVYRLGGITVEELVEVVGEICFYQRPVSMKKTTPLHAPGTSLRHYAPETPLIIGKVGDLVGDFSGQKIGALSFQEAVPSLPIKNQVVLSPNGSLQEAAQRLFGGLRYLDELGCDVVLAPLFPPVGLGRTINERLKRASYKNDKV